jgi:hypothetical protein
MLSICCLLYAPIEVGSYGNNGGMFLLVKIKDKFSYYVQQKKQSGEGFCDCRIFCLTCHDHSFYFCKTLEGDYYHINCIADLKNPDKCHMAFIKYNIPSGKLVNAFDSDTQFSVEKDYRYYLTPKSLVVVEIDDNVVVVDNTIVVPKDVLLDVMLADFDRKQNEKAPLPPVDSLHKANYSESRRTNYSNQLYVFLWIFVYLAFGFLLVVLFTLLRKGSKLIMAQ